MGDKSKIEWTDATWGPVRGCAKVSKGCANCYAERMAARFCGEGQPYHGLVTESGRWTGAARFVPEKLADPFRWRTPRRVFVNPMSDLFHESLTNEQIAAVFGVMAACPRHTFQVLTKRPERMAEWFRWVSECATERDRFGHRAWTHVHGHALMTEANGSGPIHSKSDDSQGRTWPLPNVWLGVSVEDQGTAAARIPWLLKCPAAVRWVSVEPMLGPVDLEHIDADGAGGPSDMYQINALTGRNRDMGRPCGDIPSLSWVVCGGESGPNARPMHPDWARSLRDQCAKASVPFMFKQWGEWCPRSAGYAQNEDAPMVRLTECGCNGQSDIPRHGVPGSLTRHDCDTGNDAWMARIGKSAAGRLLDGVLHGEYPEVRNG